MWRYVLASLIIGLTVSLIGLAFYQAGVFPWLGAHVHKFYSNFSMTEIPAPPDLLRWLQYAVLVLAAFGVSWAVVDVSSASLKFIIAGSAMLIIALASPVFALYDVLFEPFSGIAAAGLAYIVGLFYSRTEAGRRKRLFRELVANRVSEQSMTDLARAPYDVKFNGENRGVTVLVCRVFNHAELRENLRAREAIELFNYFLKATSDFLLERGAYLDEFAPDGVRFYFGLPLPAENHADDACRAALELKVRLENLARECEARWLEPVEWGIGLVSGEMTVGLYGSERFAHFSALGAPAEFARRLCGANRNYQSSILASASTFQLATESMEFRPMDLLQDAEADLVAEIYELIAVSGELDEEAGERRDAFWRGVVHWRAGDDAAALREFGEARPADAIDPPVESYIEQVRARLAGRESEEGLSHARPIKHL